MKIAGMDVVRHLYIRKFVVGKIQSHLATIETTIQLILEFSNLLL